MRRLARRMAGELVCYSHRFGTRVRHRVEISARGEFVNGLHAGPGKFRDVASALEILVEAGRPEQRHRNERCGRYRERGETSLKTHPISIQSPGDDDNDGRHRGRERDPPAQAGKYIEQECRRVAIHDHHIEEVDRHPEFFELEAREQRQRDQDFQRDERRHDRPAQQNQPQPVEHDPGEEEDGNAHGGGFGHEHEDHRAGVQ